MARIFRTSLLLLLLIFLWEGGGHAIASLTAADHSTPTEQQHAGCISSAQPFQLQDAEPSGFAGQINPISFARPSRAQLHHDEYGSAPSIRRLTHRASLMARLGEHLSYIHPHRLTHPACDYYIFALRRIII
jgi:hypothetical protein